MRLLLLTLALVSVISVSSAGDLPDLERTMAITLGETRFVVEDVPVRLSREDAV